MYGLSIPANTFLMMGSRGPHRDCQPTSLRPSLKPAYSEGCHCRYPQIQKRRQAPPSLAHSSYSPFESKYTQGPVCFGYQLITP